MPTSAQMESCPTAIVREVNMNLDFFFWYLKRGDEMGSGDVRYIPVMQADVHAHTTCRHGLYNFMVLQVLRYMHVPRNVLGQNCKEKTPLKFNFNGGLCYTILA